MTKLIKHKVVYVPVKDETGWINLIPTHDVYVLTEREIRVYIIAAMIAGVQGKNVDEFLKQNIEL